MSTSNTANAFRPWSSSDGRSGTWSLGARVSAIGKVEASGTHAVHRLPTSPFPDPEEATNRSPHSASGFQPAASSDVGRCGTWS